MDPDTPMVTANMNATWKGKITLSANYKEEPTANLNGLKVPVVENGDGLYAVSHDVSQISTDWNKTEYRYAGANVNNYVSFNNEIWRIIGIVNVQTDSGIEQRIKIVRQDGVNNQKLLGNYYWDKNTGYTNNWATSKLKDMLNGIYYESGVGECYNSNKVSQCDFNTGTELPKGLDEIARNMIDKEVIWNIGGSSSYNDVTSKTFYEKERGTSTVGDYPSEWSNETDVGEKYNGIGLIYPSDFGYAVGGEVRTTCLDYNLFNYSSENCSANDWLNSSSGWAWTMTPYSAYSQSMFAIISPGYIDCHTYGTYEVWPTLYLKSTIKITPNQNPEQEYGTVDNPFQLSVQ